MRSNTSLRVAIMSRWLPIAVFLLVGVMNVVAADKSAASSQAGSSYLFVWAGDAAHTATDFLSVVDVNPSSPEYGQIVATVPIGVGGTMPHHTEYEFPQSKMLFANGWVSGRTFIFDLNDPLKPRLAGDFKERTGYTFPHSFARLPNGNLLGTFQSHSEGYTPGGGLVEVDEKGNVIRSSSALDPAVDKDLIWPYSLAVDTKLDVVITSSTPMGWPRWKPMPEGSWPLKKVNEQVTAQVQVWRLSNLKLLKTVTLADSNGKHNQWPAEPRLLADGSIYVNTFSCGLYLMNNVNAPQASAQLVYTFPGNGEDMDAICAVPVVVGHYWVQTVGELPGLIVLDVSNPEKPVEVSRLVLDKKFTMPHWLAADRKGNRLVLTGADQSWLLLLRLDPRTGKLSTDEAFHNAGAKSAGISFDRSDWPHGKNGPAVVHGALFGP
jgi:hypothetical protein